jgi:hypothetical protein
MPFDGSGTFNRENGVYTGPALWQSTRDSDYNILASQHDDHDQDLADGLSIAVTRDGQGKMTASFVASIAGLDLGSTTTPWRTAYLDTSLVFKGASFSTTLAYTAPTAARTVTLRDLSGTVQLESPVATKSANFDAERNNIYFIDTNAIVATLPAAPAVGDTVQFIDAVGTLTTFTVGRNGKPIMSLAEDLTVDVTYFAFSLVFQGDTNGWRIA